MSTNPVTRRDFLKAGGALVVSCGTAGTVTTALSQVPQSVGGKPALLPDELDSWIAVLPDGSVKAFFGKMDMGQGVDVAIGQIVAEELEIGLLSVSAPVRDSTGEVVAALASSTSVGRSSVEAIRRDVVPLLVDTAERISADLGHKNR